MMPNPPSPLWKAYSIADDATSVAISRETCCCSIGEMAPMSDREAASHVTVNSCWTLALSPKGSKFQAQLAGALRSSCPEALSTVRCRSCGHQLCSGQDGEATQPSISLWQRVSLISIRSCGLCKLYSSSANVHGLRCAMLGCFTT